MTETIQQYSQAETNRLIRAELKASHPGTAFTVRISNGAGITQTVISWEIPTGRRRPSLTATTPPKPASWQQVPARRRSTPWRPATAWQWASDDGVKIRAPGRLVATEAGELPRLVRYGAGNVTANPTYRNIAL